MNGIIDVDVEAVQDAIQALDDAGVQVQDVEDIRPVQDTDADVQFVLNCRAASRTTDLALFTDDPDADADTEPDDTEP